MPDGGKGWRASYRLNSVRKLFEISVYPTMGLAAMRKDAIAARELAAAELTRKLIVAARERRMKIRSKFYRKSVSAAECGWADRRHVG
jgi:hypothetical protein